MTDQETEDFSKHLLKVCQTLNERVDSVRIFVTFQESDGSTKAISRAAGNWYAQFGGIKQWITQEEEKMKIEERKVSDGGESV